MATQLSPVGKVLKQAVILRRYENTVADRVRARLSRARDRLVAEILSRPLEAVSPGRQQRRLESLFSVTDEIVRNAFRDIYRMTKEDVLDLGVTSAGRAAGNARRFMEAEGVAVTPSFTLPSRSQLLTAITTNPMNGYPLRDWYGKQSKDTQASLRREMTIGYTRGETIDDLVVRIRGRSVGRGRYEGGVIETSTRHAEGIARTAVNFMDNQAALMTYQENADVLEGVEFCATLDERTCEECASLDGEVWALDDPKIQTPPLHINDRCTLLPVIVRGEPGGRTREAYPEWFAKQPSGTQDAILGPGRARLVRDGKRTFSDLVRSDGTRVPLRDLEDDDD